MCAGVDLVERAGGREYKTFTLCDVECAHYTLTKYEQGGTCHTYACRCNLTRLVWGAEDEEETYDFHVQEQECAKLGMNEEHVGLATKHDSTARIDGENDPQSSITRSFWDRLAPHMPQVWVWHWK